MQVRTLRRDGRCVLRLSKGFAAVRSPAFTPAAGERYASVLVRAAAATVSIVDGANRTLLRGRRQSYAAMDRVSFDLHRIPAAQRRDLRLLVVRNGGDSVELDDVRLHAERPGGGGLAGLYGFVDLHTHPFAQLGSKLQAQVAPGGRNIRGRPRCQSSQTGNRLLSGRADPVLVNRKRKILVSAATVQLMGDSLGKWRHLPLPFNARGQGKGRHRRHQKNYHGPQGKHERFHTVANCNSHAPSSVSEGGTWPTQR